MSDCCRVLVKRLSAGAYVILLTQSTRSVVFPPSQKGKAAGDKITFIFNPKQHNSLTISFIHTFKLKSSQLSSIWCLLTYWSCIKWPIKRLYFFYYVYLLCASDINDDADDRKLLCTCENTKGTCQNGTCIGDYCFYTWVHGEEERGCFSKRHYKEQCSGSFKGFFVRCCKENECNALMTPPPNISEY